MSKEVSAVKPHHHRSSLKQQNKPFKRGRSKLEPRSKGRRSGTDKSKASEITSLQELKHRAKLLGKIKRAEENKSKVSRTMHGMPKIILLVSLCENANLDSMNSFNNLDSDSVPSKSKSNFQFVKINLVDEIESYLAISEVLVLVVNESILQTELSQAAIQRLSIIRALGSPSAPFVVITTDSNSMTDSQSLTSNLKQQRRRSQVQILGILRQHLVTIPESKAYWDIGEVGRETEEFTRAITNSRVNGISWRNIRPYMLADDAVISSDTDDGHGNVSLVISGYNRNNVCLSANRIVYIPGFGTFTLAKICAPSVSMCQSQMDMDSSATACLEQIKDPSCSERLGCLLEADPFSAEAMMDAAEFISDYSMHSEINSSILDNQINDPESFKSEIKYSKSILLSRQDDDEDMQSKTDAISIDEGQTQLDDSHEKSEFRTSRNKHFPDEIELDCEETARGRLQRYRGVPSLRTSDWDPNESLPPQYSQIHRFANYRHSKSAALKDQELVSSITPLHGANPFQLGQKLELHLENIPIHIAKLMSEVYQKNPQATSLIYKPLPIFGLLRHEQKPTVVNVLLRVVTPGSQINNKQLLIAQVGPRRLLIRPILSEHTSHRLHRTLKSVDSQTGFFVATFIAPATYDPSPVLVFAPPPVSSTNENYHHQPSLIATGSLLDLDSQRINVKRVTLTGSPYRVNKKSVVVRFMFDTPEDVIYFRPVELVTRLGARGNIRESVGTHGYMKCVFDRTVFQHDTVAMHLYKRIHPKIYPDCTHF